MPGRVRTGPETYGRKGDAERALVLVEAQITTGDWTDPERGRIKLADYADAWITERPGLRPRSVDNYRWLLKRYIAPHIGGVPIGKLSTALIRQWRATLISEGVSVSMAAKAYRLLRAVLMRAADEDKILPRNPCRIKGAGDERPEERPVLTVAQVFELAEQVGRRPVGNIRALPAGGFRFSRRGEMRTAPDAFGTRAVAEQALYEMAGKGEVDYNHDRRFAALVLLATLQPSLGRGHCAAALRSRSARWHGAGAGRLCRAFYRRDRARATEVQGRTTGRRRPGRHHPGAPGASSHVRPGRAKAAPFGGATSTS